MDKYFGLDWNYGPFKLFSASHILVLVIILVMCVLIQLFKQKLKHNNKFLRYSFASIILILQISMTIWYMLVMKLPFPDSLPLHLCDITAIVCALMIVNKSYFLYEIIYFWGIAGATQALLTPDIGNYTFPHYVFFQFFIVHGLSVIVCIYMTIVDDFKPSVKSIAKSFIALNIYTSLIAVYNYIFNTNYLFICEKPAGASLIDFLGPWPWYILSLEFVGLVSFIVCYLPFLIKDIWRRQSGRREIAG